VLEASVGHAIISITAIRKNSDWPGCASFVIAGPVKGLEVILFIVVRLRNLECKSVCQKDTYV
jgi:hypothetical protein